MIIEVKNKDTYIPLYGGNRDLPEADQIKIHHRYLLPGERKKYLHTEPIVLDMDTGEVDRKVKYIQDESGIVKAIVTKIENLNIKVGSKTVKVDTAEKLYSTSGIPQKLIVEIEMKMLNVSPEVDQDFLSKPSV